MERESEEVADRIHSLAIRLLRRLRAGEQGSRLSVLRLSTLASLVELGPSSVGRLAAEEEVPAPAMNRQITALERAGYVTRQAPEADGRERVKVTPAGVRALEAARTHRVARLAEILDGIDDGERDVLLQAAETVDRALRQPVG